ncbi:hypothetical protein U1Q18_012124, partial [Sarracenia purpurea var. burkii]
GFQPNRGFLLGYVWHIYSFGLPSSVKSQREGKEVRKIAAENWFRNCKRWFFGVVIKGLNGEIDGGKVESAPSDLFSGASVQTNCSDGRRLRISGGEAVGVTCVTQWKDPVCNRAENQRRESRSWSVTPVELQLTEIAVGGLRSACTR